MSSSYNQNTIKTLTEATNILEIQNEVHSVLNSIITDIEIKHDLEMTINHQLEIQHLQQRCDHAEQALEEYILLEKDRKVKNKGLVEDLIDDLGGLHFYINELQLIKDTRRSDDVDQITQQETLTSIPIIAMEDKIDQEVQHKYEEEEQKEDIQIDIDENTDINEIEKVVDERDQSVETGNNNNSMSNDNNEISQSVDPSDQNPTSNNIQSAEANSDIQAMSTIVEIPPRTKKVTKRKKKIKKKVKRILPPTLQSLNSTTLMSIFEFMDALDIVNLAQTNVLMYSKVDSLFGLGGAGFDAGGRDIDIAYEEQSIEEEIEVEIEIEGEEDEDENLEVTNNHLTRPTSDQSFSSNERATIVSIPSTIPKPPTSETTTATPKVQNLTSRKSADNLSTTNATNNNNNNNNNDESSLDTKTNTKNTSQSIINPLSSSTSLSTTSSTSTGTFQLSSAVASALADKLSPMELSAIITIREQLRTREQEMMQMREQFEILTAKLDGTLSVNKVLTVKVKEQQLALDQNKEIVAKMNRQTASDQEVIAFLDERVQELERQVDNFDNERKELQNQMDKIKKASEKQLSVLGDMLTFEREQLVDQEKEWKSAKKLLVKEVKSRRAQLMTVEAERDGYCEENTKLKEALLSIGNTSKKSKSFDLTS